MSPEAQTVEIALACGAKWVSNGWRFRFLVFPLPNGVLLGVGPDEESPLCDNYLEGIPDYPNDLNAMREAEAFCITSNLERTWIEYLTEVVHGQSPRSHTSNQMVRATAPQRAETLIRAIGKWDDTK